VEWLNYHHLLYFWMVSREGTISRAAEKLHIGQPAISTQIRSLETALGHKLFKKSGRLLELTETGQTVFRYADEIFSIGRELIDTIKGHPTGKPIRFVVGIVNAMPKLMVRRLLEPALRLNENLRLVCVEDSLEQLLSSLTVHAVDLVLSDTPITTSHKVRAFNHSLGDSEVGLFATKAIARQYRPNFPKSLNGAPMLLPGRSSAMRRTMDGWMDRNSIHPQIRAEFDDTALLKAFGQSGEGIFPGAMAIEDEICRQYEVECVGVAMGVREPFFAISAERRIKHPAVLAITSTAKQDLFI
jgi:LysR family transcriptional regulator, transcriptional activator of nhaA